MTSALQDLLERHVASGTVPGAVASLGTAELEIGAAGAMSVRGTPMRADAIVRIQSMTKAVTTVAALRLVEAGRLRLDEPVERWLPELADRQVLKSPTADLADTSPAVRAITLRHLLTNASGYGMVLTACPLQRAMADSETDAGVDPVRLGAEEWLARLAALPLTFQPGEGWRYHHSFGILGILIARVAGRPSAVRRESRRARLDSPRLHPLRPDVGRRRPVRGAADRVGGAPPADDQRPGAGYRQDAGQLLPGLLGRYRLGLRRRCRHRGRAGRPLRMVRRTGHQLLR